MTNMSISMSSEPFQQFPKPRARLLSATLMSHDPLQQQSPNRSRNWAFPLIYHAQILTLPLTTDLPKNIKKNPPKAFFQKLCTKMSVGDKSKKKRRNTVARSPGFHRQMVIWGEKKNKSKRIVGRWINT